MSVDVKYLFSGRFCHLDALFDEIISCVTTNPSPVSINCTKFKSYPLVVSQSQSNPMKQQNPSLFLT